ACCTGDTVARAHELRHAARLRCVIQEMLARAVELKFASAEEVHALLMMQWTISPDWTAYETEHYNFFLMVEGCGKLVGCDWIPMQYYSSELKGFYTPTRKRS